MTLLVTMAIFFNTYTVATVLSADNSLRPDYALLIGVPAYKDSRWPRLDDITLQIEQLRKGLAPYFRNPIEVIINPNFAALNAGLDTFLRLHGNDAAARLFIYYSGHGYTNPDLTRNQFRGYITAADTPFVDGSKARYDDARPLSLSMDLIVAKVSDVPALQVLVVFDSCFSGTVFSVRSSPKLTSADIKPLVKLPVREFITAGNENETIPAHSPIPQLLLNAMAGEADTYSAGFVTGLQIQQYLWGKAQEAKIGISPEVGKLPGGVFDRGEFAFPVISSGTPPPPSLSSDTTNEGLCPTGGDVQSSVAYIDSGQTHLRLTTCATKLTEYYAYSYEVKNLNPNYAIQIRWTPWIFSWIPPNETVRSRLPSSDPPAVRLTRVQFGNQGEEVTRKMIVPDGPNYP